MSWSLLAFATDFSRVSAHVKSSLASSVSPFSKCTSPLSIRSLPSRARSLVFGLRATASASSIEPKVNSPESRFLTKSRTLLSAGVNFSSRKSTIWLCITNPNSATPSQLFQPIFSNIGSRFLSPLSKAWIISSGFIFNPLLIC